jgi:hypothetical protein
MKDGNTGIQFRSIITPGGKKGIKESVVGPQVEMEDYKRKRYWSGAIYGQSCGGYFYPLWLDKHEKARNAINKKGEWNRVTIEAIGDTVKTWLNGVPAAHWKSEEYKKGYFGLQIHAGPRSKIYYRNIKVKEL